MDSCSSADHITAYHIPDHFSDISAHDKLPNYAVMIVFFSQFYAYVYILKPICIMSRGPNMHNSYKSNV